MQTPIRKVMHQRAVERYKTDRKAVAVCGPGGPRGGENPVQVAKPNFREQRGAGAAAKPLPDGQERHKPGGSGGGSAPFAPPNRQPPGGGPGGRG